MLRSALNIARRIRHERLTFIKPSWSRAKLEAILEQPEDSLQTEAQLRQALRLDATWQVFLMSSGRSAWRLALETFKAQRPQCTEVIIPSYGCRGIYGPVKEAGLTPVFVDIDASLLPDEQGILNKINEKTLCVMAHNILGLAAPNNNFRKHCAELDIPVLDDNCQSIGLAIHPAAQHVILSFGISKTLALGAGGALLTKDNKAREIYSILPQEAPVIARARYDRLNALFLEPLSRHGKLRLNGFQGIADPAFSNQFRFLRMSAPDVKMLGHGLKDFKENLSGHARNHESVASAVKTIPGVRVLTAAGTGERLAVIFEDEENLEKFSRYMFARNIEVEKLYRPLHRRFEEYRFLKLPDTEKYAPLALSLPTRWNLTAAELQHLETAIREYSLGG